MKRVRKRSDKAGLPPGSLVGVSADACTVTAIKVFIYNPASFTERDLRNIGEFAMGEPGTIRMAAYNGFLSYSFRAPS